MFSFVTRVAARGSSLLVLCSLVAGEGSAQVIRGVVVESGTRKPVASVLVSLVDSGNRDLQRFLADADGSFRFLALRPGRYSVRAERVGMTTETVDAGDLGPGDTITVRIAIEQRPIALEGIQASGERRCELREDLGEATQRVWEEARKALRATSLAESAGRYVYELEKYVRELAPGSLEIRSETRATSRTMSKRPIESRPVESLIADGWVVFESEDVLFFAPDANVLLSDEFLATHCLRLRAGDGSRSHLLGLEFRPVRIRSAITDIEGVLWLARETGGLEWLDFSYVNLPGPAGEIKGDQIGGRVGFRGLPDGSWIVSNWHIRMPRMTEERDPFIGVRARLVGIVEEGGQVASARQRGATRAAYARRSGSIVGEVRESNGTDAVSEGRVGLVGVGLETDVGAEGRFGISALPAGVYSLAFLRPVLAGLDRDYVVAEVRVQEGDTVSVRFQAPDPDAVLARACGVEEWAPDTGVLQGHVAVAGSRVAGPGVAVVAEWVSVRDLGTRLQAEARTVSTETTDLGAFRVCGVPTDSRTITVTAGTGEERTSVDVVLYADEPVVTISLRVRR